jgi:hypothetical protein
VSARAGPDLGPYFTVPKGIIRSGIAAQIGPSALALYIALCEHANRDNTVSFTASDKALASDTDISERTIGELRKILVERKLIECRREPGHSFEYTLLPVKGDWVRIVDRPRIKRNPRAHKATRLQLMSMGISPATRAKYAVPFRKIC